MRYELTRLIRLFMVLVLTVSACQCDDTDDGDPPPQAAGDAGGDSGCANDGICNARCDGVVCEGGSVCVPTSASYECVCLDGERRVDGVCTVDLCAALACDGAGESCRVTGGAAVCECAAGFHEADGACVEDETCRESTCGGHGTCSETDAGVACACEPGWGGEFCGSCDAAAGFVDDGNGGCTDDPCAVTVCDPERVCVVQDDAAVCACAAGTHEDDGRCVTDTTCGPNSCNDHGQCSEAEGRISCVCEAGWAAPFCQTCDADAGYHDDGAGGCTTDVCVPNPCDEPHRSVCTSGGGQAQCGCDAGYHDNGGACVPDETCAATSCGDHGQCDDSTQEIVCTCDAGYAGAACDVCAAGYHDDGAGGCTTDVCLPNPCSAPHQSVCTSSGTTFTCGCDAGFHPDGAGGCTDDPCLPDLCAAQNQACRVTNDAPECYTPVCDDGNPCTDDTLVGGECQFPAVADGTACALDACTTGGTCQAGQCSGTAPLFCDDGNPCTDDSCQVVAGGCVFTSDDTNVPDDMSACTDDSCAAGIASHTNDDSYCDDASWCTGIEVCAPLDPAAGADGCVVGDVPMPPPTRGPCEYYAACDDATQTFTLVTESAGTTCNDGIACTSGDVCDGAGGCGGTLAPSCPGSGTCASTVGFAPLNVEVAYLDLTVTYEGQDPAAAALYGAFDIFAISKESGAWHQIADYYGYSTPRTLELGERIVPGVYDLMYLASTYSGDSARTRFGHSDASSPDIAYGLTYLERDVVLGAGLNTLALNVPIADVDVTVTYDGQDPVVADLYGAFDVWAVEQSTGGWHRIVDYYGYSAPRQLEYGERLPSGTYDLIYLSSTYSGDSAESRFGLSDGTSPEITYGRTVLQRDVVVSDAGPNAIAIDIPVGELNVSVTYDGQDPVAADLYGAFDVWAVEKTSGAWHQIVDYYGYSNPRELQVGTRLIPGTYDLMYVSSTYSGDSATTHFGLTDGTRGIVYGRKYLARDVVVGNDTTVIDLDIPVATIAPTVTYDGQDPAAAGFYGSFDIWAVEQETGAWHRIADYYGYSSPDELRTGTHLLPGTYDLLYMATTYSGDSAFTHFGHSNATTPAIVYGSHYVQRGVVITDDGPNAFAVDVQEATITPTITYNGVDPAVAGLYGAFDIWAVSQETGGWHRIADYYGYGSNDELELGTRLPPGTYDLLYVASTYSGDSAYRYFGINEPGNPDVAYGTMVLQRDFVVSPTGSNPVALDIRPTAVTPLVTYEGQNPVTANLYGAFDVWAVARETDTWHRLADYYGYSNPDELQYTNRLLPGVYDLVYLASTYSGDSAYTTFGISDGTSTDVVYGRTTLAQCVLVP